MTDPYPNCVTTVLKEQYADKITDLSAFEGPNNTQIKAVFTRPLRPSDPKVSLGVFAANWQPDEYEMGNPSPAEPTLQTYQYAIQVLVKHSEEQAGRALHGLVSKSVRSMLYRDQDVRLALSQLTETSLGVLERFQRCGVRQQRFANNEIDGQFLFLSTAEFWVQTESVPA